MSSITISRERLLAASAIKGDGCRVGSVLAGTMSIFRRSAQCLICSFVLRGKVKPQVVSYILHSDIGGLAWPKCGLTGTIDAYQTNSSGLCCPTSTLPSAPSTRASTIAFLAASSAYFLVSFVGRFDFDELFHCFVSEVSSIRASSILLGRWRRLPAADALKLSGM